MKNIVNCNESIKDFSQNVSMLEKQYPGIGNESFNLPDTLLDEHLLKNEVPQFINTVREGWNTVRPNQDFQVEKAIESIIESSLEEV